jgi:NADPH:quinone reductase-like Zn-dependent oxidoreductase
VITTVGSKDKINAAKELGADFVVIHSSPDWAERVLEATGGMGVDLVFEHFGGEFLAKSIFTLARGGRLISFGSTVGTELKLDNTVLYRKRISIAGSYMGSKVELERVLKLIEWGRIKPVVSRVFPLERAREAHEFLESRQQFGKVVLKVS